MDPGESEFDTPALGCVSTTPYHCIDDLINTQVFHFLNTLQVLAHAAPVALNVLSCS